MLQLGRSLAHSIFVRQFTFPVPLFGSVGKLAHLILFRLRRLDHGNYEEGIVLYIVITYYLICWLLHLELCSPLTQLMGIVWNWKALGGIIPLSSLSSFIVDGLYIEGPHPPFLGLVPPRY